MRRHAVDRKAGTCIQGRGNSICKVTIYKTWCVLEKNKKKSVTFNFRQQMGT